MADLITMDEYKAFASIEGKNKDPQIISLISSCSRIVQDYIGYDLGSTGQRTTYLRMREGVCEYMLPSFDISIDEVRYIPNGYAESAGTLLSLSDFEVEDTGRLELYNTHPHRGDTLKVVYQADKDTLESIKLATMLLVKHYFKEEFNKTTVGAGGQTVSYQTGKNFPPQVRSILLMYRIF